MGGDPSALPDIDEYEGVQARYYDRYFTGLPGDEEFYLDIARKYGGPVLELGCGSGRTLLPIARSGIAVVGIDRCQPLLDQAQDRLSATSSADWALHCRDMRDFDLGLQFALVTAPYRTFQHMLTPVDQARALECVHRHLAPGGRFALNQFDPLLDIAAVLHKERSAAPELDTEFDDPETGDRVRVLYRRGYDLVEQILRQELWFETVDEVGSVRRSETGSLTLRYTFRYEMEHLAEEHGFRVESLHGGFSGEAYPGYGEQIWVLEKVG